MDITGNVIQVMPLQTGEGKNGTWRKQNIVIETEGQYPKKVCIVIWGDKVNENLLVVGKKLKISFDIESREYESKWYTEVKAWKVVDEGGSVPTQQTPAGVGSDQVKPEDDLPF